VTPHGPPVILVVDDSEQDIELLKEACRDAECRGVLTPVRSVDEAISYFEGRGKYGDRDAHPLPALVLLDIQMPSRSGFELLQWLRRRAEEWHRVPVIMLTTSHDFVEIRKAYDMGANSFLVKPTGFDDLTQAMRQVMGYWLERNRVA
jgi:CheY-like chemotaxis protein